MGTRAGLLLLEDAAQAHGAAIGGRRVGTWGTATFSFYPSKNMTTIEGGMVLTNDAAIDRRDLQSGARRVSAELSAACSKESDGWLILMPPGAGVPATGPDRCWTTWVSSWASVRLPESLSGSYFPD